ncbi:MAG: translation elongation factor Ts [Candidatus Marinimicrobia bacterium]|nr:translation elongation factor Ts [Candidatus Neomarinimicrobiota bacterium]
MNIDAKSVKNLRERIGAGIMDCKEALTVANGNIDIAIEVLRKKGIAKAEKKAGRKANQGIVLSYIHPGSRIGVLLEVNCETDFVAKTETFIRFVKNLAMQIAATNPLTIERGDLDPILIEKEKEIYKAQVESLGKPQNIFNKIVDGKIEKYYQEVCLLEQNFIKDNDKTIQDLLTSTISSLGENVTISRFSRYEVGEFISSNGEA